MPVSVGPSGSVWSARCLVRSCQAFWCRHSERLETCVGEAVVSFDWARGGSIVDASVCVQTLWK